ncbi:IQ domain-containing protein [Actinidia chinensis var. chinensis]|uniref:IQ domain-containing protein n=1 Tax=Actinidia chinensis var. chinensis TaxID=1590841 RepID=A0A2R6R518_ACTCC|nr:IQ domain-containing protein [Actinidia chinensis var. chinensis]
MGIGFSIPLTCLDDLDRKFEDFLVRSLSFGGSDTRIISDSKQQTTIKSFGSRKMVFEGSVKELGTTMEIKNGEQFQTDSPPGKIPEMPSLESGDERFQAAVKLQKVYKSFRTRRQVADCAVLVEQRWRKVLDFTELNRISISFFDFEKPETVASRWSRARTRAAKVGKGLSKDERARKLALQHWLEAIDPRHRYGHNLQFYYAKWLHCESKQPFFYWLDIGEGKEINLERCPRSKLHEQCIKYLGPTERTSYEITIEDGKFLYKQTGRLIDTRGGPEAAKWIFVLSTSKTLYVGQKQKGKFQHSSFLAGGATLSAGRLVAEDGILKAVWPHSGHYLPTEENFEEFMLFLKDHNVDLSIVQKSPTEEEEEQSLHKKRSGIGMDNSFTEPDFTQATEEADSVTQDGEMTLLPLSRFPQTLSSKIIALEIPRNDDVIKMFNEGEHVETPIDAYETMEEALSSDDENLIVSKQNLFDEDQEADYEEPVPREKIIERINSQKRAKSYQLAHRLSCKWTTGAGPRIGCVRDYPSELQNRALEEVNLSPRSTFPSPRSAFNSPRTSLRPSPRVSTPTSLSGENDGGASKSNPITNP